MVCYGESADVFPGIVARNKAVLEYERFVHRTFYPHIIHPYSRFRVFWEVAFLFVIPLRLIVVTTLWIFISVKSVAYTTILTLFQLLNIADVILGFFTGYVESRTEIVILDNKKIACNYLLKRFLFDFIPSVPVYAFVYIFWIRSNEGPLDMCALYTTLFSLNMLILLRGHTFFLYLYHTSNLFRWYPYLLGIIIIPCVVFLLFLLLINWLYLGVFTELSKIGISFLEHTSVQNRLDILIHIINVIIDYLDQSTYARSLNFLMRFCFLLVIFFCSIFFLVYLTNFVLLKMKRDEKFINLESRIFSFSRKRNLPSSLRQKIFVYFLFLQENKYCMEDEIFHYIPNTFKAEIFFHLCLPLLKNFYAFENLPTYVLRRLAESMTYQLYLPNEIVMAKTDVRLSMYFIQRGTVALYSENHVELYHFEAGSSVNGKNFVLGDANVSQYAISIEVTEVYRLDYDKYMDIMAAYPKLLRSIMKKLKPHVSETIGLPEKIFSWN